jgi:hypothetical protein
LSELRFYFDESVDLAVSEQLAIAGADVVSAHSLDKLGDKDITHLQRAAEMERVLCTCDADFLALASQGIEHAGVVYGHKRKISIGDWVREIRFLRVTRTAEDAVGRIFFVQKR